MTAFFTEVAEEVESLEQLLAGLDLVNFDAVDEGPIFQTNVYSAMRSLEDGMDLELYLAEYVAKSKLYQDRIAYDDPEILEQDKWMEVVSDFCDIVSYTLNEAENKVDRVTIQKWMTQFEAQLLVKLNAYYGNDAAAQTTITKIMQELDDTNTQINNI
jgi:hypothetical protein